MFLFEMGHNFVKSNSSFYTDRTVFYKQDEMFYKYKLVNMSKLVLPDWHDWVDAHDELQKLHITSRTLQRWRLSGVLPYSHVKGKYYYRKRDVLVLLMNNYNGKKGDCDE